MTGRFYLINSGAEWIICIPFTIGGHEKVACIDSKDTGEKIFFQCFFGVFWNQDISPRMFVENKLALRDYVFVSCVVDVIILEIFNLVKDVGS